LAVVVTTPWGRMSTLVCYDVFFPDVVRKEVNQGVDYIIVPANAVNNSPRVTAIQLAQTMLRAVENHTAVAFAFNNGTSALIDSNGRLLTHEVLYSYYRQNNDKGMAGTLPVETGGTLYTKIVDLFIWVVLGGCLAGLFIGLIRKPK
jgi:apolipoprotein N-acyltransferase